MYYKSKNKILSIILLIAMVFGQFAANISFASSANDSLQYDQITKEEFKENILNSIVEYSPNVDENSNELSAITDGLLDKLIDGMLKGLDFNSVFDRIMQSVDSAVEKSIAGIRDTITGVVKNIGDNVQGTIVGSIGEITDDIQKTIVGSIDSIGTNIKDGTVDIVNKIIDDGIKNLADNIGKLTNDFLKGIFKGPITGVGEGIGESIGSIGENIGKSITSIMEGIKTGVDAGIIDINKDNNGETSNNATNEKYDLLVKEIKNAKAKLENLLKETLKNEDLTAKDRVEVATAITGSIEILNEYLKVIDAELANNSDEISNIDTILDNLIKDKIDRLKNKDNNENAVVDNTKENIFFTRIEGSDRYETAVNVAETAYPEGVSKIILASGENYADALAANSLVAKYDIPIILTGRNFIPSYTKDYILSNTLDEIIIVGGENSISKSIENNLSNLNIDINRIFGKDRYETSLNIAKNTVNDNNLNNLIIANGTFFADALSASTASAKLNIPILLSNGNSLSSDIEKYLNGKNIENLYIVGGENSIKNSVKNGINYNNEKRLSGNNRVETSIAVANEFFENANSLIVASGNTFPDALTSTSISKTKNIPLILNTGDNVNDSIRKYIDSNNIEKIYGIGGVKSLPKDFDNLDK